MDNQFPRFEGRDFQENGPDQLPYQYATQDHGSSWIQRMHEFIIVCICVLYMLTLWECMWTKLLCMSKWFYDIFFLAPLLKQPVEVRWLNGLRISTLKQDEYSSLCGSACRSVIYYVHMRMRELLYCCVCWSTTGLNLPKRILATGIDVYSDIL
jgi:hypothetical protein